MFSVAPLLGIPQGMLHNTVFVSCWHTFNCIVLLILLFPPNWKCSISFLNICIKVTGIVELLHISLGKWAYGWAGFWWCHRDRKRRRVNMKFIVPRWAWSGWGKRSLSWQRQKYRMCILIGSSRGCLFFFIITLTSKQIYLDESLGFFKILFQFCFSAVHTCLWVHMQRSADYGHFTCRAKLFSLHLLFSCLCNK